MKQDISKKGEDHVVDLRAMNIQHIENFHYHAPKPPEDVLTQDLAPLEIPEDLIERMDEVRDEIEESEDVPGDIIIEEPILDPTPTTVSDSIELDANEDTPIKTVSYGLAEDPKFNTDFEEHVAKHEWKQESFWYKWWWRLGLLVLAGLVIFFMMFGGSWWDRSSWDGAYGGGESLLINK